jgi:hypothetical protein
MKIINIKKSKIIVIMSNKMEENTMVIENKLKFFLSIPSGLSSWHGPPYKNKLNIFLYYNCRTK